MNAPGGLSINFCKIEKKRLTVCPQLCGVPAGPLCQWIEIKEKKKRSPKSQRNKASYFNEIHLFAGWFGLACWFCRRFVQKPRGSIQFMINHKIDEKIMLMTMVKRVKTLWRGGSPLCGINLHFLGPCKDDKALMAHIIIGCRQRSDGKKKSQVAGNAT